MDSSHGYNCSRHSGGPSVSSEEGTLDSPVSGWDELGRTILDHCFLGKKGRTMRPLANRGMASTTVLPTQKTNPYHSFLMWALVVSRRRPTITYPITVREVSQTLEIRPFQTNLILFLLSSMSEEQY
ncbi:unnamed protein product [Linum trigynum]|uniref:Uncharacterized protein n=1 Tax=Linum trigynum TaxID=586398 RepID=A0AAV2CQX3_9ROSI